MYTFSESKTKISSSMLILKFSLFFLFFVVEIYFVVLCDAQR